MKIAVMQPYFFPYLGYFQLFASVDTFIYYDDVNFIKRGWVNRNRILLNNSEHLISIPLVKASQNKLINEIEVFQESNWGSKLMDKLEMSYAKATYKNEVLDLVNSVLDGEYKFISDLCINSVNSVASYLGLNRAVGSSSNIDISQNELKGEERILAICKALKASTYINPEGGKELYSNDSFSQAGMELKFLEANLIEYKQGNSPWVPGLSIIDVLMHNSKEEVLDMTMRGRLTTL